MAEATYPLGHKIKSPPALSVLQVLAQAQALGVVLALSDGELHATGSRAGIAQLAQHIKERKPEIVKMLAAPPDPGMAQLLALADRYCTAIQASDKACADWRSDIQATPPSDREELTAYLRGQLAKLSPVAPAILSTAAPTTPASSTWREADKADQAHYWGCPQCLAVVKTSIGTRCTTGQQLHQTYMEAASHEGRFLGAKPDPAKPVPPFHAAQPWRIADGAWLAHWQQCPQCQTAGRTSTPRCTQGEDLFTTYQQATEAGK